MFLGAFQTIVEHSKDTGISHSIGRLWNRPYMRLKVAKISIVASIRWAHVRQALMIFRNQSRTFRIPR